MAGNLNPRLSGSSLSVGANTEQQDDVQQDMVFPMKLYCLLDEMAETGQTGIISWLKDGNGFKIKDRKKFAQDVLPKFFGTNQLKSFQRSLNLWGFASGKKLEERGIYTRSNFVRGHPELCLSIKRCTRITTATGERKRKRACPVLPNEPQAREEGSTGSSSSAGSSDSKEEEDNVEDEDEEEEDDSNDDEEVNKKSKPHPNRAETQTENIGRRSVSSDAIIQELRRRQDYREAQQQEGAKKHAPWIPPTAAPTAGLSLSQPNSSPSLLQGVGTGLSLSSTTHGGNNNFTFPLLGAVTAAAAARTPAEPPAPAAPSSTFGDSSIIGALMNAYISSQQQTQSRESPLMHTIATMLLQQQQQQQEQAAAAARNDQLIANVLRNYAAADDEQKRQVTALLLMLLESTKQGSRNPMLP